MLPRIAVTIGDPAGIGPEVVLKALADPATAGLARWTVVGDASVVRDAERRYSLSLSERAEQVSSDQLASSNVPIGVPNADCGQAAVEYVRRATELCLADRADAIVTAPVNKEAVTLSGLEFTGHTEYIAELCGASDSRMLLVNDRMRVVHVSTHLALRQACELDPKRIVRTIELGQTALVSLGITDGLIAVCGLNPHAGENGLFGDEDSRSIAPAVEAARQLGIRCEGPLPADTVFLKAFRGTYALVIAMYHDQGHIPMKLIDFENTVNVSLGLPIIRTSVDHGTAFDIAGKNQADPTNMKAAMKLAVVMAKNRIGAA